MMIVIFFKDVDLGMIARSYLKQFTDRDIVICKNVQDFYRVADSKQMVLFVCLESADLVRNIRYGNTSITPFCGISLLDEKNKRPSNLGVNGCFQPPFCTADVRDQYQSLINPKQDFISIGDIYIGPDRRIKKQQRPTDRRVSPHPDEQRFRPNVYHGKISYERVPNLILRRELAIKLQQLKTQGRSESIIASIRSLLTKHDFDEGYINNIVGV